MILKKLRKNPKEWLKDVFPILKWFPKYRLSNIPYDFIAGLTVALTLLPISLAYAQMASLKAEYGLYSSFLSQFIYIFMGTSKDAIIGPSAINSMFVGQFNAMNPLSSEGDNTYAVILSFMSGIILFLIGILKLGFIVNLFSIPVVSGFTTAASLTIMASQLKSFFGLKYAPNDAPAMFVRQVKNVYDNWDQVRYMDMYFGIGSLVFLLTLEYSQKIVMILVNRCGEPTTLSRKRLRETVLEIFRMFVASRNILVFIPATGIAYYLISTDPRYEQQLTVVGYIKRGFPVPRFPRFSLYNHSSGSTEPIETAQEIFTKLSVAFIIMPLMLMMELFGILKALGRKNGYQLDPTNELVSIGIGNFLQSFIQAYPVTAATAKSALNDQCRVKSLLSTLVSIVLIIVALEAMTGIFYYVPKAVLAAILIAAAHHLFDYETAIHIYREYKPDLFIFTVTFLLCLFYDLAYGILISILLNMISFLRPVVRMEFCVTKEPLLNSQPDFVTVIQLSHGMQYPSVDKFIDRMMRLLSTSDYHFVIDCRFVTGIDFSGLQAWRIFLRLVYQNKKHVIFANLLDSVRQQLESVGLEHFRYVDDIPTAIQEHQDLNVTQKEGGPQRLSPNRHLRHMISIVSTSGHSSSRRASRQASVSGNLMAAIASISVDEKAAQRIDEIIDEADKKEQEERLMKVLSFQPHYLHDIPIASDQISISEDSPGKDLNGLELDEKHPPVSRQRGFSIIVTNEADSVQPSPPKSRAGSIHSTLGKMKLSRQQTPHPTFLDDWKKKNFNRSVSQNFSPATRQNSIRRVKCAATQTTSEDENN